MHDTLIDRTYQWLVHRRHRAQTAGSRPGPDGFGLDPALVGRFTDGTLGAQDEARLAQEVAELVPHAEDLPFKGEESLNRVISYLGGEVELMTWLDRHPGRPRLTARISALLGLLDEYAADPGVVGALRAAREREPYPAALRAYLVPQTNEDTLSALAYRVKELLSDQREKDAIGLADAVAEWVRQAVADADDPGTAARNLADLLARAESDLTDATPAQP
ncbi:hypothetical protein [Streptomyces sp. NPDC087270]|uniref:hypothetical protein n=1 Tax=Streptomyces sp. NPDC087270 TaxID=3365774 RepID=UPI0037FACDDC